MPKKLPRRMCVACREMKEKRELLRIVRLADGMIELDLSGKKPGRGAYICADAACFAKAKKSRAIPRALQANAADEFYVQVETEIVKRSGV